MWKNGLAITALLLAGGALGGCAMDQAPGPQITYDLHPLPDTVHYATVPGGDAQLLTVRDDPNGGKQQIVCLSPSPDWATAATLSRGIQAGGTGPNAIGGNVN